MGNYSVPEEIRALKPKGTNVKRLNGKYYVYEQRDVYIKEKGRSKTVTGKLLGRITLEGGFIRNNINETNEPVISKDYGEYNFVYNNTRSLLTQLFSVIDVDTAERIYVITLINYINGFVPLARYKDIYDYSYLSNRLKTVHLSKNTVSEFMETIGRKSSFIDRFYEQLISNSSKQVAVDGHCVTSYSNSNDLTEYGNKYSSTKEEQYNIVMAYDVETQMPLYSRVFRGGELDKISIKEILINDYFKDLLLIVDNGFYSKSNIELFKTRNKYIIPLSENLIEYKKAVRSLTFDFSFSYGTGKNIRLIKAKTISLDSEKEDYIYVCKDITLASIIEAQYSHNLEIGTKGHSQEFFDKNKDMFGVIVLQSNLPMNPTTIFTTYKRRWGIETFNNVIKNDLDFKGMGLQTYHQTQAFSFIIVLCGIVRKLLKDKIKSIEDKTISSLSLKDVLVDLKFLKIFKHYNKWIVTNVSANNINKFAKLGVDTSYPKI